MRRITLHPRWVAPAALLAAAILTPGEVRAHCDGLDGPVVQAARQALESGNPDLVLIWVKKADEAEVKEAFQRTLAVRKLGPDAKDVADRWFFETLVRVHRAGEGAPYTGLKPAGRDLGPAIPAADTALRSGSPEALVKLLMDEVSAGVRERFRLVLSRRNFAAADVPAGREYVEAYVPFIHYVERLYEAASTDAHGHFEEGAAEGHPAGGPHAPVGGTTGDSPRR